VSAPASLHRIVWQRSDGAAVVFALTQSVMLVGRDSDADVRIEEPLVSRAHARLERRGTEYVLIDLGSTNLTRVNGEPVQVRSLQDGDELQFARAVCVYQVRVGDGDSPEGVAG
jgi:pSer/pThr/pTyr-binding forkhead associated (FHA) protein